MHNKAVKFNLSAYFVLPLVGLHTCAYSRASLIQTFVTYDHVIVLQLIVPVNTRVLMLDNLLGAWVSKRYTMAAYKVPEAFRKDFDFFIEGKYSLFSERAFETIYNSIPTKPISPHSLDEKVLQGYMVKMDRSRHPFSYSIGKMTVPPYYIGAIAPPRHPARENLKIILEDKLRVRMQSNLELYSIPDMGQELLPFNLFL